MSPRILAYCVLVAVLVACHSPGLDFGPPPDPQATQACGIHPTHCEELHGGRWVDTGYCCPNRTYCGGPWPIVGCPEGVCCPVPDDHEFGAELGGGVIPQRRTR